MILLLGYGISNKSIAKYLDKIEKDYIIYASTHTNKEANILKKIYKDYDNVIPFKLDMKDT